MPFFRPKGTNPVTGEIQQSLRTIVFLGPRAEWNNLYLQLEMDDVSEKEVGDLIIEYKKYGTGEFANYSPDERNHLYNLLTMQEQMRIKHKLK